MDAFIMEKFFHFFGNFHVFRQIPATDVCRCDDPVTSQLPHMEFVNGQYTVHFFDQSLLDCVHLQGNGNLANCFLGRHVSDLDLPGYVLELFAVKSVHFLSTRATRSSASKSREQLIMLDPYSSGIPTPSTRQSECQ